MQVVMILQRDHKMFGSTVYFEQMRSAADMYSE